jgi:hypothetical protein
MSSKLVAKAIVLSSLCATGIVAQTTLANAGPLAGLPCKKALGAVVRGDDACVKIGGAYVWRRLANVNDPVPAAAQPIAATQAPAPQPATAPAASAVAPATVKPVVIVLPDPCQVIDRTTLDSLFRLTRSEVNLTSEGDTADLRACEATKGVSGDTHIAVSRPNKPKYRKDSTNSADYLPFGDGTLFFVSFGNEVKMFTERKGIRLFISVGYLNGVESLRAAQDFFTATANRL